MSKIKSYMMPVSMLTGAFGFPYLSQLGFLMPYLIFAMLLITYCNISLKDIRFSKLHLYLLAVQLLGSISLYGLVYYINPLVAQSVLICILAPTATSAVVIAGMLGGNVASLTAYSLLSNIAVAVAAPLIFAWIGNDAGLSFWTAFVAICQQIIVLLILPLLIAVFLQYCMPKAHAVLKKTQSLSFYLWNVALIVVTARIILFITEQDAKNYLTEVIMAACAMVICVGQFWLGRKLGRRFDNTVAGGQGLGQKNTILAIWMAQMYLNPISSIGPGSYVLWQNIVNSYQVWRKRR